MWNFSFYCRESKTDRNGLANIELSISIDGKRMFVALPRKCKPADFKKASQGKRNNDIQDYLALIRTKLNTLLNDMIKDSVPVTAQTLKDYFKSGGVKSYTISSLKADYLDFLKKKNLKNNEANIRKYELALNKFIDYLKKDIEVTAITFIQIEQYKAYLYNEYEETTVGVYLRRLKTAFIFAQNTNKININPFFTTVIPKNTKEVEKLDYHEIEKIENKEFSNNRLNKVKDMFLFQVYTGLSYSDMIQIEEKDLQQDNGMYFVRKKRQKTGIEFFTVLNNKAIELLRKYNFNMNLMSNQKCNAYLKEIQDICNITKPLHTHIARHTAATRFLNDGMPIEIVSKILGHTNTRQTMHYAKLMDKTVLNAFKQVYKTA